MTKRAFILGLSGAITVCGLGYFNDNVLRQTQFVGSHMPFSVYGTAILFVLINAVVFRLRRSIALTGQEMALIMGMTLVACCIPGTGLLRTFIPNLIMQHHVNKSKPHWQSVRLLDEIAPEELLVTIDKTLYHGALVDADETTVTFAEEVGADPGFANPDKVKVYSGKVPQVRRIVAYDPATRVATLDAPWTIVPQPGWKAKVLRNNEDEILSPYLQGRDEASVADDRPTVPWHAWRRALILWVAMILALWIAYIGLAMLIHTQWSEHECLAYPVATFAASLLPDEGQGLSAIFRDRKFQVTAGMVLFIYLNNYFQQWFPEHWVEIPLTINFSNLWQSMGFRHLGYLAQPKILLAGVGIAYLLSTEVAFSASIAPVLYTILFWNVMPAFTGTTPLGGRFGQHLQYERYLEVGGYLGMAATILYTGRRFYLQTFKKAIGLKSAEEIPSMSVWGARILMIALGVFAAGLMSLGINWLLAIIYAIALMIPFLVTSRVLAETGLFFFAAGFWPSAILTGILGPDNVGIRSIYVMFMFCLIIMSSVWESMMPYFVNSLKLISLKKNDVGKGALYCGIAVVLGLLIALPLTIHIQYSRGANLADVWGTLAVPGVAGDDTLKIVDRMEAQGKSPVEAMHEHEGFSIFKSRPLDGKFFAFLGMGFSLFLLFTVLRLRVAKWPLHPVIFVIWTSHPIRLLCFSFFLGWLFKALTSRFAGSKGVQAFKPIAIGLIAGELLGAVIPMIYGAIYYLVTGDRPQEFRIF